jgi:hypothetical protein
MQLTQNKRPEAFLIAEISAFRKLGRSLPNLSSTWHCLLDLRPFDAYNEFFTDEGFFCHRIVAFRAQRTSLGFGVLGATQAPQKKLRKRKLE